LNAKVSTIRVLFFDPDSKSLLISSSQMRKKARHVGYSAELLLQLCKLPLRPEGTTTINMSKGILGQCAQKQQAGVLGLI